MNIGHAERLAALGGAAPDMANTARQNLEQALELLAVLRAWYRTPGDVEDAHRHHELFPLVAGGGIDMDKRPLWDAVDALLARHGIPQPGECSTGNAHE